MPLSGLPCSSLGAAGERSMSARQPDGKAPVTAQMPPGFVPAVRLCPLTNKKMVLPLRPWRRRCGRIAEQEFRILHLQCAAHVWTIAYGPCRPCRGRPCVWVVYRWSTAPVDVTHHDQRQPDCRACRLSDRQMAPIIIGTSCADAPRAMEQGFASRVQPCLPAGPP